MSHLHALLNSFKVKNITRTFFYNLLWLAVFVFVIEMVLKAAGLGYDNAAFEPDTVYHHAHKKNYTFINNNPAQNEYSNILVKYDNDGYITNPAGNSTTGGKQKLALLGDSYAEGLQVDFDKSITGILEQKLAGKAEIKNFAVGGYSPVIYYLQCKKIFSNTKPDVVVLFLYANDVREDKEYLQQAAYTNGTLTAINGGQTIWRYSIIRKSYLLRLIRKYYMQCMYAVNNPNDCSKSYLTENSLEEKPALQPPTLAYLDSIHTFFKQSHTRLIVTAVPSKYKTINRLATDSSDFSTQCFNWASANNIEYVNLDAPFLHFVKSTGISPFYKTDIHFNEYGHAIVAGCVFNVVSSQGF